MAFNSVLALPYKERGGRNVVSAAGLQLTLSPGIDLSALKLRLLHPLGDLPSRHTDSNSKQRHIAASATKGTGAPLLSQ